MGINRASSQLFLWACGDAKQPALLLAQGSQGSKGKARTNLCVAQRRGAEGARMPSPPNERPGVISPAGEQQGGKEASQGSESLSPLSPAGLLALHRGRVAEK